MMEMAGLAQKGGAVLVHCRIAEKPEDITAVRVAFGEADAVIGGDLVTTSGPNTLSLMQRGRTGVVCNSHQIISGDFTKNADLSLPVDKMSMALTSRLGENALAMLDATALAEKFLGDAIYSNVLMLGAAWQAGLVPMSLEALQKAIELNGAGVAGNLKALDIGRWAVAFPEQTMQQKPETENGDSEAVIATRIEHLTKFQNKRLAEKYENRLATISDTDIRMAVAKGYHKFVYNGQYR